MNNRHKPRWLQVPLWEIILLYRFTWRDLSASLIPATLFTLAAAKAAALHSPAELLTVAARSGLYFTLYIYSFCLSNQIAGVDEDRLNKPDRPIPSGLCSLRAAKLRWFVVMLLFPAVAWLLGGVQIMLWALCWQLLSVLHNHHGWCSHWATKNFVVMTLGTLVQLAPAWQLVTELTPLAWRWIVVVSLASGSTISLQDLRDVEGDRLTGRKTLPIVIGDGKTRLALSVCFLAVPLVVGLLLLGPAGLTFSTLLFGIIITMLCLLIAVRLLLCRSKHSDHKTYMLWTYLVCVELTSAIFAIPQGA